MNEELVRVDPIAILNDKNSTKTKALFHPSKPSKKRYLFFYLRLKFWVNFFLKNNCMNFLEEF